MLLEFINEPDFYPDYKFNDAASIEN